MDKAKNPPAYSNLFYLPDLLSKVYTPMTTINVEQLCVKLTDFNELPFFVTLYISIVYVHSFP